jgi:salicylate hydroxylase
MDVHENVTDYLHRTARYHRAHLHQALLANVPRDIIHLKKSILSVNTNASQEKVTLEFEDGTIVSTDILLGADGLRSV